MSQHPIHRAREVIPGGVNSPVRAFNGVGGDPLFIQYAKGAYLYDLDDRRYIDYIGSWGPMIAGHAHPEIIEAVQQASVAGLSYGAPTELEITMAETINAMIPSIEMVRMVNSGTEATMSAIRLARGFTGRDKLLKFEGCYHGHSDSLLVKAGSGALTLGVPTSPGVPASVANDTLTVEYNNLEQVREVFNECGSEIAAIIVEPIAGNMNCILPVDGFLQGLRDICTEYESVLIFDEVMTGFRVARGGVAELYGVDADLTTLGKVIGGGLPVGAFGGRKDIMEHLAPVGPVYQAGTLSGNPIAMTAGLKTLEIISREGFYKHLNQRCNQLLEGLSDAASAAGIPFTTSQAGGMFGLFFSESSVVSSFAEATDCDLERFKVFFHKMLEQGVYLAPSAYEAGFISAAHSEEDINETITSAAAAFASL